MATYELVAVARVPQSAAAPTLTEIERIVAPDITWTEELVGPGSIGFSCDVDRLPADVRTRLKTYATDAAGGILPLEVRLYRDGTLKAAAAVLSFQVQNGTLSATCPGLEAYLAFMFLTSDLVYTASDQFTIGKGLVDHFQALTYGNYGIVTSGIGTSGVTRDRSYIAAEQHQVSRRLRELAAVDNGFEYYVHPSTRALTFVYPTRGSDLSSSVFLDIRNISDDGITISVLPGDLVSDALGVGTGGALLTSTKANTTLRAAWGRAGGSFSFDGVTAQATLDGHTQAAVDARDQPLVVPNPGLIPISGVDVTDFGVGDTVTYDFDSGLGRVTRAGRIAVRRVSINDQNEETMSVGFA